MFHRVNKKKIFNLIYYFLFFIEIRIVCYYTNWSVYRQTNVPILYPDAIEPSLCTHIHVAFALINPVTLKIEPSEKHDTHYTDVFNTVD
jgi:GH18 family chitinase